MFMKYLFCIRISNWGGICRGKATSLVRRYIPMRKQGREGRLWPQVWGGGRDGGKESSVGTKETGPNQSLFQDGGHSEGKGGDEGGVAEGGRGQSHREDNQLKVSRRGRERGPQKRFHVTWTGEWDTGPRNKSGGGTVLWGEREEEEEEEDGAILMVFNCRGSNDEDQGQ